MTTLFPAQDSTLAAAALAANLLGDYGFPAQPVCRFFRKGICDTYRVYAGDQEYYLKVYRHARRTELDVAEEVRLLNHLAANGVSVARPVMRLDGAYVNRLRAPEGLRYAVLFEAAEGVDGDEGDDSRLERFGEMAARMHQASDQLPGPYRRSHLDMRHLVDENLPAIAKLMAHRSTDFALITRIAEVCAQWVSELLPNTKPEYGICHGDLHGGDVRYDMNSKPVLFDFDSSGCGWRALDIGVFLASEDWMDVTAEAEERRQRRLAAFLAGYSTIRELTEQEQNAVQLGPPIRHIYLMGFVLRYTAVWQGEYWANDSFIEWHMTWFRHWAERSL
jgi:Ser/Thr protein kinase RdoA (MazF antagonist)